MKRPSHCETHGVIDCPACIEADVMACLPARLLVCLALMLGVFVLAGCAEFRNDDVRPFFERLDQQRY